jgi:hypothetical protein
MRGARKDGGTYICMIDNIMSVDNNLKNLKKKCEKRPLIGYTIYIHTGLGSPSAQLFVSTFFGESFFFKRWEKGLEEGTRENQCILATRMDGRIDDPFINQEYNINIMEHIHHMDRLSPCTNTMTIVFKDET